MLVLSKSEVSRNTQALTLLADFRAALQAGHLDAQAAPQREGGVTVQHLHLPDFPAWAVVVRTGASQLLQLHDAQSGEALALMEASPLATLRASLISALAADLLARSDAARVCLLGLGPATSGALKALRLVRSLKAVTLFAPDAVEATEQAFSLHAALMTPVHAPFTAAEAVAEADLIILTGKVELPLVELKPGAHLTVLGADGFVEPPLPRALLERAARFCDSRAACAPWAGPVHADLGQLLRGELPGRVDPEQLTFFQSSGPAFLELVAAWHVYQGARHDSRLTRVALEE